MKVLEPVTYKLNLPGSIRIIRIYYILVLEPADPEAPLIENIPDIDPKSQEKVWKVKKIINSGPINDNKRKYFIKWKEYPHSNNT